MVLTAQECAWYLALRRGGSYPLGGRLAWDVTEEERPRFIELCRRITASKLADLELTEASSCFSNILYSAVRGCGTSRIDDTMIDCLKTLLDLGLDPETLLDMAPDYRKIAAGCRRMGGIRLLSRH
jgi:hypothetical protein